jgi:hypothetical protein
MIPVVDLLGEPVFDGDLGFGNELELARAHFLEVLRHDMGNGVGLCFCSSSRPIHPHSGRAKMDATSASEDLSGR